MLWWCVILNILITGVYKMGVLHCMALVGTLESDLLEYMRSVAAKSLDRIAFNFVVIHGAMHFCHYAGKEPP